MEIYDRSEHGLAADDGALSRIPRHCCSLSATTETRHPWDGVLCPSSWVASPNHFTRITQHQSDASVITGGTTTANTAKKPSTTINNSVKLTVKPPSNQVKREAEPAPPIAKHSSSTPAPIAAAPPKPVPKPAKPPPPKVSSLPPAPQVTGTLKMQSASSQPAIGGVAGAGAVRKPVAKKRKIVQTDDAEVQVSERRALNSNESSDGMRLLPKTDRVEMKGVKGRGGGREGGVRRRAQPRARPQTFART